VELCGAFHEISGLRFSRGMREYTHWEMDPLFCVVSNKLLGPLPKKKKKGEKDGILPELLALIKLRVGAISDSTSCGLNLYS